MTTSKSILWGATGGGGVAPGETITAATLTWRKPEFPRMPRRRCERVGRALMSWRWAILPDWLHTINAIAQRYGEDPETLEERLGRPLDGTARTTIRNGVAKIPVHGPIFPRANLFTEFSGATSLEMMARDFNAALESDDVQSILFDIDSPGGVAFGVGAAANMIARARGTKPITAFVSGMAASAAYHLAVAADEIVLDSDAMVGSIGVVTMIPVQEQPDRDGFREIEIVSSNAPNKRPDPRSADGLKTIRAEIDALESNFIDDVARLRGVSRETVLEKFGRGGMKIGRDAIAAGMADRIGTFEEIVAGSAAGDTTNKRAARATPRQQESEAMNMETLTLEALTEARPDLVSEIEQGARDRAAAEHEASASAMTLEEFRAARPDLAVALETSGATSERERILGVQSASEPGCDELIAEMIADGKTTPDQAGRRVLEAIRARNAKRLKDMRADEPDLDAGPSDDKEIKSSDPKAIAEAAKALMKKAEAEGRPLNPAQAVRQLQRGDG